MRTSVGEHSFVLDMSRMPDRFFLLTPYARDPTLLEKTQNANIAI